VEWDDLDQQERNGHAVDYRAGWRGVCDAAPCIVAERIAEVFSIWPLHVAEMSSCSSIELRSVSVRRGPSGATRACAEMR